MRPFERRAANAYPYYKLSVWDARQAFWRPGRQTFRTEAEAKQSAPAGERCRVSVTTETGKVDLDAFVAGA